MDLAFNLLKRRIYIGNNPEKEKEDKLKSLKVIYS